MDNTKFNHLIRGSRLNNDELRWLYEHHLAPLAPRIVIEIGVARGGTSRLLLDLVGEDGLVVGLDLEKEPIAADVLADSRFHFVQGDSSDKRSLKKLHNLVESCDLLLIDGDHSASGVLRDTDMYLPLLREEGLAVWNGVNYESPEGIKQSWYGVLRPRLLGVTEHSDDPHDSGFGVWYKTEENAVDLLDEAEYLLEEGEDDEAITLLERLVAHRHGHGHAWFDLGLALWDVRPDQANRALAMAVAARPNLFPYVEEWCLDNDEIAPLPPGEGRGESLLDGANQLTEMGLPRRALELLARVPKGHRDFAVAQAKRINLLDACNAPMREIGRALVDAVEALPQAAMTDRLSLLEYEGSRVLASMLRLHKYAEAVRLVDSIVNLCPDFSSTATGYLTGSLFFCVWAEQHGLPRRGPEAEDNYFRRLLRSLSSEGHRRVGLLPAGTISKLFLNNDPETQLDFVAVYDAEKKGARLGKATIQDLSGLRGEDVDILLLTCQTSAASLRLQVIESGFPENQIRDITLGTAASFSD